MADPSRWETGLPALVLAAAAVLGGGAGLLIAPHAAAVVLASTLVQLGATALGWRLTGRSAVVTGVVAVVTLGTALEPPCANCCGWARFPGPSWRSPSAPSTSCAGPGA